MQLFWSLSISNKLIGGFATALGGLIVIAGMAGFALDVSNGGLEDYRVIARNSNAAGRVQANLLYSRMAVKDYLLHPTEATATVVRQRAAKAIELADLALQTADNPTAKTNLEKSLAQIKAYASTFEQVVQHDQQGQAALTLIAEVESGLVDFLTANGSRWAKAGNIKARAASKEALEHVTRTRVAVYQYQLGNLEDLWVASVNLTKAEAEAKTLPAPYANDLLGQLSKYRDGLSAMERAHAAKSVLVKARLDMIGPEVATLTEDLKLAYIQQQDTIGPSIVAANQRWLYVIVGLGMFLVVVGIIGAKLTIKAITDPVAEISEVIDALARGDFSQRVDVHNDDEIGTLAKDVNRMAQDVSEVLDTIQKGANTLGQSSHQLSTVSQQLIGSSQRTARDTHSAASAAEQANAGLGSIASASSEMNHSVASVSSDAEQMSANMQSIAAAAEEMSQNTTMVAAAVEQMTASISEVAKNASASSELSGEAMSMTEVAVSAMTLLRENGDEIGKVTDVIRSIADQTNLLALNATIEAAGAGAAGRGFAVVASEVKALATQSGRAADDISTRISQVQDSTRAAADAMAQVASFVTRVNQSVGVIAMTVEQHDSAANEISHSLSRSSQGAQEIAENVARATAGAGRVAQSMSELRETSTQMARNSSEAALGVENVARTIISVREVAAENDEGSKQVNETAVNLDEMASLLQDKVSGFRFSQGTGS